MKVYVERGENVTLPAPYPVAAGGGCLVGRLFGVAQSAVATIGALVVLCVLGVYALPKKAGDTPAPGALVYWDDANKVVTTTAAGNVLIGVVCQPVAALGADATVNVRLNGSFS